MTDNAMPAENFEEEPSQPALHFLHQADKSHICHFYESREDLIEVLIPYFKEGLEKGEFCLWGCDEPLGVEDAMRELKKAVPNLEDYIDKGQLELFPAADHYLGRLDSQRTYNRFMEVLKGALSKGFTGFRCDGNTRGVPSRDWLNLMIYESYVDAGIRRFPVTAMCSYPLSKCGKDELEGVQKVHQSVIRKRGGAWEYARTVPTGA